MSSDFASRVCVPDASAKHFRCRAIAESVVSTQFPVQFGARRSGDPAVLVAASDKIRRFELPLPLGSAVGAAFDVVRYRTLSSQENIWDTEQREQ